MLPQSSEGKTLVITQYCCPVDVVFDQLDSDQRYKSHSSRTDHPLILICMYMRKVNKCFSCRPLLYGLSIKEQFSVLRSYNFSSKDYQITPGSPWNYAIHLSTNPENSDMVVNVDGFKPPNPPFSQQGAPVSIQAKVNNYSLIKAYHNYFFCRIFFQQDVHIIDSKV